MKVKSELQIQSKSNGKSWLFLSNILPNSSNHFNVDGFMAIKDGEVVKSWNPYINQYNDVAYDAESFVRNGRPFNETTIGSNQEPVQDKPKIFFLTQEEYDNLPTKDGLHIYLIKQ